MSTSMPAGPSSSLTETKPKPFVFVLIPFKPEFDDVYEVGIKAACSEVGAYSERVDEQLFDGSILERVYNQIAKADVIISEMTGGNPNVYYETGYAHALNKRVILVTRVASDIPFDLKQFPHVVYEGSITTLKVQLQKRIRWCIEHPLGVLPRADVGIEYYVNGFSVANNPEIYVSLSEPSYEGTASWKNVDLDQSLRQGRRFDLIISLHNGSNTTIITDQFSLALVVPKGFAVVPSASVVSVTKLPTDAYLFNIRFPDVPKLFVDSWDSIGVVVTSGTWIGGKHDLILRCFTEFGRQELPFKVHLG